MDRMTSRKKRNGKKIGRFDNLRKHFTHAPKPAVDHFVALVGKLSSDIPPHAECTCGEFKTEPNTDLYALGVAAKAHSEATGHRLRGR